MIALSVLALALTSVQPASDSVYRGVNAPRLIYRVEPAYPQAARDAKVQGAVLIHAVIDSDGGTRDRKIVRGLGYGLDEAALDAVSQWLFRPGTKEGRPVSVAASIEVNFRLLDEKPHQQPVGQHACAGVPQPSSGQAIQALANLGNPIAQYVIGCASYQEGVLQDYVQAHMWFNLAAAQGLEKAARARDAVSQKMTPEQMSEAQARARAWTVSKD